MARVSARRRHPKPTFSVTDIIEAYEAGKAARRTEEAAEAEAHCRAEQLTRQFREMELDALLAAGPQPTRPAAPALRLVVDNR